MVTSCRIFHRVRVCAFGHHAPDNVASASCKRRNAPPCNIYHPRSDSEHGISRLHPCLHRRKLSSSYSSLAHRSRTTCASTVATPMVPASSTCEISLESHLSLRHPCRRFPMRLRRRPEHWVAGSFHSPESAKLTTDHPPDHREQHSRIPRHRAILPNMCAYRR